MSLRDAMDYLIDTARENHKQRERSLDEMNAMFDYMVNDHMERLLEYSTGAIPGSDHERTINSLWGCSITFSRALSAQLMRSENDQETYTRRGDALSRWIK